MLEVFVEEVKWANSVCKRKCVKEERRLLKFSDEKKLCVACYKLVIKYVKRRKVGKTMGICGGAMRK